MTLRITPARKELLQAVADGAVSDQYSIGVGYEAVWDRGEEWATRWRTKRRRTVTASIRLFADHGLIAPGARPARSTAPRPWVLTTVGRATLVGAS